MAEAKAIGWGLNQLRRVAHTAHYAWSSLDDEGITARVYMRFIADPMPDLTRFNAMRHSDLASRRDDCMRRSLCINLSGIKRFVDGALAYRQPNPVTLRALRLTVDGALAQPSDRATARRRVNRALAQVHPDKWVSVFGADPSFVRSPTLIYTLETVRSLRRLLDDPCVGPALFAPGRLDYGQYGLRYLCAAANGFGFLVHLAVWIGQVALALVMFWRPDFRPPPLAQAIPADLWPAWGSRTSAVAGRQSKPLLAIGAPPERVPQDGRDVPYPRATSLEIASVAPKPINVAQPLAERSAIH